jgi:hypothetical protein
MSIALSVTCSVWCSPAHCRPSLVRCDRSTARPAHLGGSDRGSRIGIAGLGIAPIAARDNVRAFDRTTPALADEFVDPQIWWSLD